MSDREAKCEDRIDGEFADTVSTLEHLFEMYDKGTVDDAVGPIDEFGYGVSYVGPGTYDEDQDEGFYEFIESGGGPSSEIRFYSGNDGKLARAEYLYKDWGDGAVRDVTSVPVIRRFYEYLGKTGALTKG